jgi:hypothetical protein
MSAARPLYPILPTADIPDRQLGAKTRMQRALKRLWRDRANKNRASYQAHLSRQVRLKRGFRLMNERRHDRCGWPYVANEIYAFTREDH